MVPGEQGCVGVQFVATGGGGVNPQIVDGITTDVDIREYYPSLFLGEWLVINYCFIYFFL